MGEDIKLLHPELTGDCLDSILKEIKALNEIGDKMSKLSEERFRLEKEYEARRKIIGSMVGVVFDFINKEEKIDYTVERTNILLKNVNGGNKPW